MQEEEILKLVEKEEVLLSKDAVEFLKVQEDVNELISMVIANKGEEFLITKDLIERVIEKEESKKIPAPSVEVKRASDFKPIAKEYESKLKFRREYDITGKSSCSGAVDDFVEFFRDRVNRTKNIIKANHGGIGVVNVSDVKKFTKGREVRVAGIVTSKKSTKNGHIFIELESEEGSVKVLALKSSKEPERSCFEKANTLLLDEVIAIDGRVSDPFIIAIDVIWPDLPIRNLPTSEVGLSIAFISDTHVGSRFFLEEKFKKMVGWLNGGNGIGNGRELSEKIKYIVIAGDLVDGIGIYPRQEKELIIKDIYEQYDAFAKLISDIPEYVEIIISPGNHDAVRRAEPQPELPSELAKSLVGMKNVHLIGNPSFVEIEGFKTLVYHGTSMDSIIAAMPGMSYQNPEKVMVEMMKRRNLSPIYGENPIVPEHIDYMLVNEVPDIFHAGHVHKNGYENYKGTILINSGTWQSQTDFQLRQGHIPTPCILPIFDMEAGRMNIVNFAGEI
jgi:DNA polymerase II small subunit